MANSELSMRVNSFAFSHHQVMCLMVRAAYQNANEPERTNMLGFLGVGRRDRKKRSTWQ